MPAGCGAQSSQLPQLGKEPLPLGFESIRLGVGVLHSLGNFIQAPKQRLARIGIAG
jgi:hypothetical protein